MEVSKQYMWDMCLCYLVLHKVQWESGTLMWKLILATLSAQTLKVEGWPPVTWTSQEWTSEWPHAVNFDSMQHCKMLKEYATGWEGKSNSVC